MATWKDIPGYEGLYEASDEGSIVSCNNQRRTLKVQYHNERGYLKVDLWKGGERKHWKVSRLIALTFLPENTDAENLTDVHHKDEDKDNNRDTNLEWCPHDENVRYSTKKRK